MHNRHERVIAAPPEQIAALVLDFDAIWPVGIAPAPRPLGDRRYAVPPMIWEELEQPGAIRAFRVAAPAELQARHWFEAHPVDAGTLLRHTIDGEALDHYEAIWRERIEPAHDLVLEALLDNVAGAASSA